MLRFAPSPTGFLHMGNMRIALLNYLFAKKNNFRFFLRIDDTDKERSKNVFEDSILDDLNWIGIEYYKIIKQSERESKYKEVFEFLKNKNLIYPCFESSEELSLKRKILLKQGKPPIYDRSSLKLKKEEIRALISSGKKPHWRLLLDEDSISWDDMIHGVINFNNLSVSDPIVFRSDQMPLFTVTSVVDDADMGVSHIIRGDDHITNTAAQIKLFKLINAKVPVFGHFPLMKSKSGKGLSKRTDSFSIKECRETKISTVVILNYLKKIGTNQPMENFEGLTKLIENFDIKTYSKNSIFFDTGDIIRLNSKYLKSMKFSILEKTYNIKFDAKFWEIIRSNVDSIQEAEEWYKIINDGLVINEKIKIKKGLKTIIFDSLPKKVDEDFWTIWTNRILENYNSKPRELFILLRQILTGKRFGPSMNDLLTLLKKDEIIKRVDFNCEEEN